MENALPVRRRSRGFTFVELMVVVVIIVILITMAIPLYDKSVRSANETVLQSNLFTLRTVIRNYTAQRQKAPTGLDDLVSAGLLREIPVDPMTRSNHTWRIVNEDATQSTSPGEPGIVDVKSGSDKIALNGTRYADW